MTRPDPIEAIQRFNTFHARWAAELGLPSRDGSLAAAQTPALQRITDRLATLTPGQRKDLVAAMSGIRRLLGDATPADITLRDPRPGDIGWIVHRQARLYTDAYGWDSTFEALLADIGGRFIREFRPGLECCRVAEREGEIVGSVFVVRKDDSTAQLRMLYVEPTARGQGLGSRLVDDALGFARGAGYRRIVLWTNAILVSARRIYEAADFVLVEEERHHSFGHDLVGQVWAREL